jgi:hypothetical protein
VVALIFFHQQCAPPDFPFMFNSALRDGIKRLTSVQQRVDQPARRKSSFAFFGVRKSLKTRGQNTG